MQLSLDDLNHGIAWWLREKGNKWSLDFHNADYYAIYDARRDGLSPEWWRITVDRLWDWRAIRSRRSPNTKAEIERLGLQVLPAMREFYSKLSGVSTAEPVFLDYQWSDVAPFFDLLAAIKGSSSPVFPSKLGHFILPRLFIILDNEATDVKRYDLYWTGMKQAWLNFETRDAATEILRNHITAHASRPLHEAFPLEIKAIELCSIGRKYRGLSRKRFSILLGVR